MQWDLVEKENKYIRNAYKKTDVKFGGKKEVKVRNNNVRFGGKKVEASRMDIDKFLSMLKLSTHSPDEKNKEYCAIFPLIQCPVGCYL